MKNRKTLRVISQLLVFTILISLFSNNMGTVFADSGSTLSLSVTDGEVVNGSVTIDANSIDPSANLTLNIDGTQVSTSVYAQFMFEADGIQASSKFKNGLLIGSTIIKTFDKDVLNYDTVSVPVSRDMLTTGTNTLTLRAGNTTSPTSTTGNHDDWNLRNVRLVFADGTILRDPAYINSASGYFMGDGFPGGLAEGQMVSGGQVVTLHRDFSFVIPQNIGNGISYTWDTTKVSDGDHTVELVANGPTGQETKVVHVNVQNPKTLAQATITTDTYSVQAGEKAVISVMGKLSDGRNADLTNANIVYSYDNTVTDVVYNNMVSGVVYADLTGKNAGSTSLNATVTLNGVTVNTNSVQINVIPSQIPSQNGPSQVTLSVNDNDYIRSEKQIIASSSNPADQISLAIDGKAVNATGVMNSTARLMFDASGIQATSGFKSGVIFGDKTLVIDKDVQNWQTYSFAIVPGTLKAGQNIFTLWAGNTKSPTDPSGNHDDWNFKNIRLVLADGTILKDPAYPDTKDYFMGDGFPAGTSPKVVLHRDINFNITTDVLKSVVYDWATNDETAKELDGAHTIKATATGPNGEVIKSVNVTVDNTGPVVDIASPIGGNTYLGNLSINATANDSLSGIGSIKGDVDGQPVDVPSVINTAGMKSGAHKFNVTATDKAGNITQTSVSFNVLDTTPTKPSNPTPVDGSTNISTNPKLGVTVSNAAGQPMDVTFYSAIRYDAGSGKNIKAFSNSASTEPPAELQPQGESEFTADNYASVAAVDGNYMTTNSVNQFPYQRYDMTINEDLTNMKQLDVVWKGHSLPDRKVTVYAWDYSTGKWVAISSNSDSSGHDFNLEGKIDVQKMVQDKIVHLMVQDKIPTSDEFDFTIAWETDTQFYSKNYPTINPSDIYSIINQWIVDNKTQKKIIYAGHTGDVVDSWNLTYQWDNANKSMRILEDGNMPYGVLAGNHDNNTGRDHTYYTQYFGENRFLGKPWYGGSFRNNEDHYDLISKDGADFVVVYLSYGVDQEEIDWANQVLQKYSDYNAIIATHEYLETDGISLSDRQGVGDSKKIMEQIVTPNKNVFMVLCGHNPGASYNVRTIGDRNVIELLSDYQSEPEGGLGYLRLLHFDLKAKQLYVNTYSPYKNDYNYYADAVDELTFPLNLPFGQKQVATDYIGLNVRTNTVLGSVYGVPNGNTAQISLDKLNKDTRYDWYAGAVQDQSVTLSDVWSFTTGEDTGGNTAQSDDATLKQLQLSNSTINFSADKTEYAVSVGHSVSNVTVKAAANDTHATLEINGEAVSSKQIDLSEGLNTITVKVKAQDGTTEKMYKLFITRAVSQTVTNTPVQVSTEPLSLNVPAGVTNASLQVVPVITGTSKEATLPLVEVKSATSLGEVSVSIPSGTKISAPASWDGTIKLPQVQPNNSVSVSNGNVSAVIEVGVPNMKLTFDKAVRLLIPNQAGKSAGFVREGVFAPITNTVSADTQEAADKEIAADGEAKIDVGNDLVIWTKHFTQFVSYTSVASQPTTQPRRNSGSSGTSVINTGMISASAGGTVTINGVNIVIPAGAINTDIKVTVDKVTNTADLAADASYKLVSDIFEIKKDKENEFTKPVSITLPFDKTKVDPAKSTISIYWFDETARKWTALDNPQVNIENAVVTGSANHFTKFAVLATDIQEASQPAPTPASVDLFDIKGHWAENSIRELIKAGAIEGYPDGTFGPEKNITRAEFAVVLVKAFKLGEKSGKAFADTANHWAKKSVETAAAYEIISGYNDNSFGPDDLITREQMAAMIVRAAKLPMVTNQNTFADSTNISEWAKTTVAAAAANGMMDGYDNGTFRPTANATRAEAVTVILKAIKK